MTDTTNTQKVLYIGGHGKVGLLAAPKLVDAGHEVTSLIRKEEQVADIEKLGAKALLRDVTELSVDEWADILADFDVVVWGAGNGGRGGRELTWAVDRDAALKSIDAVEKLASEGKDAPRYLMISYAGATKNEMPEEKDPDFYPYVEAKKEVDNRLNATELDYLILGPAVLTEEPAGGVELVADEVAKEGQHTSRELVADVVTEMAGRETWPASPLSFIDGDGKVADI
ncbi:NAD(P)-binding oxidoreductase [Corynebacterium massiliense]|uniref:Sugar epimerase YhfK n=1 Tax=Corynebacterium massiliense DSM 45435 TaxID=1121364 RepID=A0ABY7U756_9CORY|nr:NAD(P)-binding oxidoreductase [Corynebacterium massiliense]WCZ32539.1 putative sugar epimerase YhfK [Corynebacterium massiliense DSM 45435]